MREILDSVPNLFCIGRNGQHRYDNMDQSMLTGMVAARLISEGDSSREVLWAINSEQVYQEKMSSEV